MELGAGAIVEPAVASGATPSARRRSTLHRLSFVLCMLPGVYFLGVLAYAMAHAEDFASALPQQLRYVVVPALIALAFFTAALRLPTRPRAVVGLTGLSILAALFLFELLLAGSRLSALHGLVNMPVTQTANGLDVSGNLPPGRTSVHLSNELDVSHLSDAVLGALPGRAVLLCHQSDGTAITYRTDRYGYRNADTLHDAPVDLVLVGDSFVEGICLPDGEDIAGQFRRTVPATINLGTRGSGPLEQLAMIGRFGPVLRPRRIVIAFYEGNDWDNMEQELQRPWLREALSPGAAFGSARMARSTVERAELVLHDWQAQHPPGMLDLALRTNIIRNTLALQQTATLLGLGYAKVPARLPVYADILARSRSIAAGWGGEVAVLYIPQYGRLVGLLPDRFVYDQVRNQVLRGAASAGVPVIDLGERMARDPDPLSMFADDGHLSAKGAAIAADLVLSRLPLSVEVKADRLVKPPDALLQAAQRDL
jgi:hypothetical protein